jgi:hypothetical protein
VSALSADSIDLSSHLGNHDNVVLVVPHLNLLRDALHQVVYLSHEDVCYGISGLRGTLQRVDQCATGCEA